MSAVYHITHQGGTRSARCLQVTKKLLSWSSLRLLSLKAVYISEYVQSSSCEQSSRPAVSNCTLSRRVVRPILRANLAPEARYSTIVGVTSTQSLSTDLDEAVLRTINSSKAHSTWSNYSSNWRIFSTWCQDHLLDPTNCETNFVLRLFQSLLDSGRSVNIIKVYIAAISHFHSLVDVSAGKHSLVSHFLKGAYRLWPRNVMRSPAWDLTIVLHSLVKAPFEPLDQANIKFLT